MSKLVWQVNDKDESYDLIEVGAINDDGEILDAVVAQVYDMAEFARFCVSPTIPEVPKSNSMALDDLIADTD